MAKISDEEGNWLEDEQGHGVYDLDGMKESLAGSDTPTGDLICSCNSVITIVLLVVPP